MPSRDRRFVIQTAFALWGLSLSVSPHAQTFKLNEVLQAIALVETGRQNEPWPWTLNVQGQSYYFVNRESAWQAARLLENHHVDNFDIGLMQINWHYHKRRFRSTWQALDPKINYRVAQNILEEHWQETRSLSLAIAHYHSKNPAEGYPYLQKVLTTLEKLK